MQINGEFQIEKQKKRGENTENEGFLNRKCGFWGEINRKRRFLGQKSGRIEIFGMEKGIFGLENLQETWKNGILG